MDLGRLVAIVAVGVAYLLIGSAIYASYRQRRSKVTLTKYIPCNRCQNGWQVTKGLCEFCKGTCKVPK